MAIDTTKTAYNLRLKLPVQVKSGTHLLSTGNETENLCQDNPIPIDEPTNELIVEMPARSLNTYIFMIDNGEETAIEMPRIENWKSSNNKYFDLQGRSLPSLRRGINILRMSDGSTRKVLMR